MPPETFRSFVNAANSCGDATYGPNVELDVYSFLTTAPNPLTDSINHERMPVLISEEADFETWFSGSPAEAFALARSFDPANMRIVQSGSHKEDLLGHALAQSDQPTLFF
jgi:putative SOS response-associated peptidase YedK